MEFYYYYYLVCEAIGTAATPGLPRSVKIVIEIPLAQTYITFTYFTERLSIEVMLQKSGTFEINPGQCDVI
jgi:hypothetical protein